MFAGISPYPHKFSVSISLQAFREKYDHLKENEKLKDVEVR